MRLDTDANIYFSALLRKGLTRRVWFEPLVQLSAPLYLLDELAEHRNELLDKFGGDIEAFRTLTQQLGAQVQWFRIEELLPYFPAVETLTPDLADWPYLAAALYANADLWSHDAGFQKQKRVRVWTTKELAEKIGFL